MIDIHANRHELRISASGAADDMLAELCCIVEHLMTQMQKGIPEGLRDRFQNAATLMLIEANVKARKKCEADGAAEKR